MISKNALRLKHQTSNPSASGSGESTIYVQSDGIYLNGTLVSAGAPPPASTNDLTCFTSTNQIVDYPSSKPLVFNSNSLKEILAGGVTTLELADSITKNLTFNPSSANIHTTSGVIPVSDVYTNCGMQLNGNDAPDIYSSNFVALPGDGTVLNSTYGLSSDGFIAHTLFEVNNQPAAKNVKFIDGQIQLTDNSTILTDQVVKIGDVFGTGNYILISTDGGIAGFQGGVLRWQISPDGSHTFGLGKSNTMIFNSTNTTGDVWSVTQNTVSKVAKLSAETVNSVADLAWRVNTFMGLNHLEYQGKGLWNYIMDEVASWFNISPP